MRQPIEGLSTVASNAYQDCTYSPYCMACREMPRMKHVERYLWRCDCGGVHDERKAIADHLDRVFPGDAALHAEAERLRERARTCPIVARRKAERESLERIHARRISELR